MDTGGEDDVVVCWDWFTDLLPLTRFPGDGSTTKDLFRFPFVGLTTVEAALEGFPNATSFNMLDGSMVAMSCLN